VTGLAAMVLALSRHLRDNADRLTLYTASTATPDWRALYMIGVPVVRSARGLA